MWCFERKGDTQAIYHIGVCVHWSLCDCERCPGISLGDLKSKRTNSDFVVSQENRIYATENKPAFCFPVNSLIPTLGSVVSPID
mmetsp:Transcript_4976/g.10468  ORF Transcript_4976/g.10468 Transcript_4976/m.10468 type:complete len:84 (+) Transcript_4976:173-424(+)